jgi:hypothetical protein
MRRFLKHIGLIFFFIVGVLYLLDFSFTKVYENSVPRTKIQYLRSFKNKKVDYIFLGSSRVENGIVPELIMYKTGKIAINLGFQAAKMSDIYIMLKLIKEYNIKAEKIFIQIDYIFNIEDGHSNVLEWELMPFIRENQITKEYFNNHFSDKRELYNIPFYRYCRYEPKIGFREFFLNTVNKETPVIKNYGFVPLYGNSTEHNNTLPAEINAENKYYDEVKKFIKNNNMKVLYFCAPFCKHTKNLFFVNKLKNKIPELYDFSQVVSDDAMFQNCSHLNREGAFFFTEYLIQKTIID